MAEEKRKNRWLINLVLIIATVGLLGVGLIPLLASTFNEPSPQAKATPSPMQSIEAKKADVEAQARGYEEVLKREPENQTALRGLLEARLKLNDIKGAIDPLEKLAKANPAMTEYGVLLAQANQQTGNLEASAQAYRNILNTKPGDLNALQGLSGLLIEQKRPEAAIGLLQDTLKSAPQANKTQAGSVDTTAVQVLLGKVFASQKRFDEALNVFDEAIKTNKQDFQPVFYKALVLKEQGKKDEAKPLFETAVSLAPAQYKDQIQKAATDAPPSVAPAAPGTVAPASPSSESTPAPSSEAPETQSNPAPSAAPTTEGKEN
ncbi:MAG: tetratricopeptide repeat protein [Leptolyngbyaceae cyanobacterium CSU_1_3]|nr:tetratricopeptide repeat protein [Leptolyngbyaceae cyanobacterium CSU_1_3]